MTINIESFMNPSRLRAYPPGATVTYLSEWTKPKKARRFRERPCACASCCSERETWLAEFCRLNDYQRVVSP